MSSAINGHFVRASMCQHHTSHTIQVRLKKYSEWRQSNKICSFTFFFNENYDISISRYVYISICIHGIVLASHPCTCVLHRQLSLLHTLKSPKLFHFHGDFHQKWHFAHPKISFAHPELPFLAKSMIHGMHQHLVDPKHLTHCGLGDFDEILDEYFSSQLQWLMAEISSVKLSSEECHRPYWW